MKLYRYWVRVDVDDEGVEAAPPGFTAAAGWSNQSLDEARAVALERAQKFVEWWRAGDERLVNRYAYDDRPMREPIVEAFHDAGGRRIAAITRNGYGAYVLNTAEAFFADIDRPQPTVGAALRGAWNALRRQPQPDPEAELAQRLSAVVQDTPGLGLRLYRTRGGHRVLVTSRPMPPDSAEAAALLTAMGSDPLYVRLCEVQQCYRARLSPKPWRISVVPPDHTMRYPWRDELSRETFEDWSRGYDEASRGWAVCEPVATLGSEAVHDAVRPVLELHDELTCAAGKPLA